MTNEQIIIKLTEKVLRLEAAFEESDKKVDEWIVRYKEEAAIRTEADKAVRELQQFISQKNREVMELKEANKKLLDEQKRDLAALESFGIRKNDIGYWQDVKGFEENGKS